MIFQETLFLIHLVLGYLNRLNGIIKNYFADIKRRVCYDRHLIGWLPIEHQACPLARSRCTYGARLIIIPSTVPISELAKVNKLLVINESCQSHINCTPLYSEIIIQLNITISQ